MILLKAIQGRKREKTYDINLCFWTFVDEERERRHAPSTAQFLILPEANDTEPMDGKLEDFQRFRGREKERNYI